jgi:transposase
MRPPDLLTMSATELDRLTVIERVRDRRLSQSDAAKQFGLTQRHISRLLNTFERDGPAALVSKRRGRRSNHAYAEAVKTRFLDLVREHRKRGPEKGPGSNGANLSGIAI